MHTLKVAIIDENQFFVYGIKETINKHFNNKNIAVKFIHNKSYYSTADLIIFAQDQPTEVISLGLIFPDVVNSKLIRVISRQQTALSENLNQWIFFRHQNHSVLLALIDKILNLSKKNSEVNTLSSYPHPENQSLTRRQHEIIYYILKEMSIIEISHHLNISKKTVNHHKRAAMLKLQLKGTTELYHWALGRITSPIVEKN